MMKVYLHDIPLDEAKKRLNQALQAAGLTSLLGEENIPLDEKLLGRVLSRPVWAKISSPHYHASAMDGFALRSADSVGAVPHNPITLLCKSDHETGQATYLDTGDPLPDWADLVIPIEHVEPLDENGTPAANPRSPYAIRIRASVTPWHNVRTMGEDMVATQLVLAAGQVLRPVDLGAIAGCGHSQVWVSRKPKVAILPTGTELVPVGEAVEAGDIIEYNSIVLAAQVNAWGGEATRFPITSDKLVDIIEQIRQAARTSDMILLNAGSSAGSEDFSAAAIEALGEVFVHGIAVRPGHPVIFGMVSRLEKDNPNLSDLVPVIGVPGYPVSAALTGEIFVEPVLAMWQGRKSLEPDEINAQLTRKITSPAGDDDYMRMAVGKVGDRMLAAPLSRGSGVITSLVRADGITIVPRGSQGLSAGSEVRVRLYRSRRELEQTIFAIGSHDISLDIMAQFLVHHQRRLISANVGSQAGLVALKNGEAHLAGSHLLDPKTGIYNLSYIERYLKGVPVKVVELVGREQGLILQKGNPKQIFKLADLTQPDIHYVNRQRGAGTRVLLDYYLDQLHINPEEIHGYEREEFTHLAIAAAILSGRADCGLGIAAAAYALNLDFIPLFHEKYQLVIPTRYYEDQLLIPLFDILHDSVFQKAVSDLPGYDVSSMGKLAAEINWN